MMECHNFEECEFNGNPECRLPDGMECPHGVTADKPAAENKTDIEALIDNLRFPSWHDLEDPDATLLADAADALSTLQAENEKLRAELERVTAERDAAIECLKNKCPFCRKYLTCQGRTINNDCWEFFGLKED